MRYACVLVASSLLYIMTTIPMAEAAFEESRKAIQLDDERQLVVQTRLIDARSLPELFLPEQPLPPGGRVVPPDRLIVMMVTLETKELPDLPLYSRIVQEYESHNIGYLPLEARLVNGGSLFILAKGPGSFSVTRVLLTRGVAQVTGLSFSDWDPEGAAVFPPVMPDMALVSARFVGSRHDDTLGVEVVNQAKPAAQPRRFLISPSGTSLTLRPED